MAYSTGSGDYNALMAAVLVHALADGWIETGGLATGWPISKGQVRGIDWATYTAVENDMTLGGAGGSKTQRYMRIGMGTTGALATTDAATSTVIVPNMAYTFTNWWIFSDTTLCDYIHVVVKFNNGPMADCYGHFSFTRRQHPHRTVQRVGLRGIRSSLQEPNCGRRIFDTTQP